MTKNTKHKNKDMSHNLSITDTKIIQGKIQGKKSHEIAKEVGITPVSVRRRLQNDTIKHALYKELQRQGITLDKVIEPVAKALNAKTKVKIGEVIEETDEKGNATQKSYVYAEEDNLVLQLQASKEASKLMGLDKIHDTEPNTTDNMSREELAQLASESDEITLTQLLFKKS